jgi:hypothetical protein
MRLVRSHVFVSQARWEHRYWGHAKRPVLLF